MMSDLDHMLQALGAVPAPPALGELEPAVFTGLARHRERQVSRRALALAGGVAVLVGMGGALAPVDRASAEPLLGLPAAAPSQLLVD
jgi:hypothetical protein